MENTNLTRKEMIGYLKNHFRYNTANSWNQSTSYARNVKIYNLDLSKELLDRACDLVFEDGFNELMGDLYCDLINQFEEDVDGYTIGFNGRSGGYLVLYHKDYPFRSLDMYDLICTRILKILMIMRSKKDTSLLNCLMSTVMLL